MTEAINRWARLGVPDAAAQQRQEDSLERDSGPALVHTDNTADLVVYLTHPETAASQMLFEALVARDMRCAMVADFVQLHRLMEVRPPHLVVMALADASDSIVGTMAAVGVIRARHPATQIMLLAPEGVRAELVVQTIKRGASWVFSPPYSADEIIDTAISSFAEDMRLSASQADASGTSSSAAAAGKLPGFETLTKRERQILEFVIEGRTNKEIATELGLSFRTVEVHRRHVMEKTGARNAADLVRLAVGS
jgi:DNA-binding NarL/FixJ family response regulator